MVRAIAGLCFAVGLVLAPALAPAPAFGAETNAPPRFTNAQDRFSIQLPPGWCEMPATMAEVLADPANRMIPGRQSAYGFELAANTNTLAPPFVSIQIVRGGRVGESYLRLMNSPEVRRRAVNDLFNQDGIKARDITGVSWDTNLHRLRFCATREDESGDVRLWHDLIFTEQGSINLTCLANAEEAERYEKVFTGVLDSFQVHSLVAYQPREVPANLEAAKFRATKVMFIPGIMVLLGLARLLSQRFSDRVMSDEV